MLNYIKYKCGLKKVKVRRNRGQLTLIKGQKLFEQEMTGLTTGEFLQAVFDCWIADDSLALLANLVFAHPSTLAIGR